MATRKRGATAIRTQKGGCDWCPKVLRFLYKGALFSTLMGLIGGALFMMSRPFEEGGYPIEKVEVNGEMEQISTQQLRVVIEPHVQKGFFRMSVSALQSDLEALPWVYRAKVRREWPEGVLIHIDEQSAVARWNDHSLLNSHSDSFTPEIMAEEQLQLPHLSGPKGSERRVAEAYLKLASATALQGLMVEGLTMNERHSWQLRLNNQLPISLGREDIVERIERLMTVYPKVVAPRVARIDGIDLRYTNGFALRWKRGEQPAA